MALLNENEWIPLGQIGKAHGLKGAFFLTGHNRYLSSHHKQIAVGQSLATASLTKLVESREHCFKNLVLLECFSDRTQVDLHKGATLWGSVKVKENDMSWLLGKIVRDSAGQELGEIEAIYNYGASDIIEIVSAERGTLQIPYIQDYFPDNPDQALSYVSLSVSSDTFADLWAEN